MESRKEYFESFADEWDKNFTAEDLEILAFFLESFNIKVGHRIVDLGCGTGVLFDNLRRKVGPSGMVVGIDFSEDALHFKIPIFLIQGEGDILTSKNLSKPYFDKITAPNKAYFLLPKAAHGFNQSVLDKQYELITKYLYME